MPPFLTILMCGQPSSPAWHYGSRRSALGSKADMCSALDHVRFTPESGHVQCDLVCPLCAISGHLDELTGDEHCQLVPRSGGGSLAILGDYFRRRYFSQMISGTARRSRQRMAPL